MTAKLSTTMTYHYLHAAGTHALPGTLPDSPVTVLIVMGALLAAMLIAAAIGER